MDRKSLTTDAIKEKAAAAEIGKGNIGSGIVALVIRLLLFVIVPLLIIDLLCWVGGRSSSAGAPAFVAALRALGPQLAIVGVPLAVLAGFWGYHLRRTKARLVFGLAIAFFMALYSAVLFISGHFGNAVDALGWFFPPLLAFGLGVYMSALAALRSVREYILFSAEEAQKKAEREKFQPSLGWGEFDLRTGSVSQAVSESTLYIKKVINRPVLVLLVLMGFLSALTFGATQAETMFLSVLAAMAGAFLILGIPAAALAFFKGYYPKGSRSRTLFDLGASWMIVIMIIWIFIWSGLPDFFHAEGLNIPIEFMALAVAIWALVDILRVGAEYYEERREWLKKGNHEVPPRKRTYLSFPPSSRFYDFNIALGKLSRGLKSARRDIFRLVTLPEIVILFAMGFLESMGANGPIYGILHSWALVVLIFGLLVAFVSFWHGYYPLGSWSRLTMGLMLVPAATLYLIGLGLDGGFNEALRDLGVHLYMPGIMMLLLILVIFLGFRQVAEFADHHYSWLLARGKEVKPLRPINKMTRIQEFRPRFGSRHNGVVWIGKGMVRYVFYTSIFIILLITMIDSAVFATFGYNLNPLADGLTRAFVSLLLIAIPLAAFRGLYGFYPAGSTSRLVAGYLMGATGATYTYTAFSGGKIMMAGTSATVSAGVYIEFAFVVVLFGIGWIIWGMFVTMEYLGYRKAWIENGFVYPVDVDEQLKLQKLLGKEERREEKLEEREQRRARSKAHVTTVDSDGKLVLETEPSPSSTDSEEDDDEEGDGEGQ
jgi:hypothetical protein